MTKQKRAYLCAGGCKERGDAPGKRWICTPCAQRQEQERHARYGHTQPAKVPCECGRLRSRTSARCQECAKGRVSNAGWSGDRRTDASGYAWVREPTYPGAGRGMSEHRYVMSRVMGRELYSHENVHHVNGDRADNRPENLELWSRSQPSGQRVADKVAWAREIIALYGSEYPLESE